MASSNRIFDRMLGIFITIGAGLALMTAKKLFRRMLEDTKRRERAERRGKRDGKGGESGSGGDEYYQSRNTAPPNHVHNGACHCQRIRFRLKAPKEIFAVDIPSKIRYPRISCSVEHFEPLSDEHIMSMYAVKSVDSGLGIHTFCSYCGMHVLFAPSTNPHEVQVNVDCLDRSTIDKVYVTYMAIQDSIPVPSDYMHAQQYSRRGTGSMYNKVSSSGGRAMGRGGKDGAREGKQQHQQQQQEFYNGGSGTMIALDDPTRYSSPEGKNKGKGALRNSDIFYNYPYNTPPSASTDTGSGSSSGLSKRDSSAMNGLFSDMTRWLSPFSKLKQAAVKQREANEACESYFSTYYGAAGANSEDIGADTYTSNNEGGGDGSGFTSDAFLSYTGLTDNSAYSYGTNSDNGSGGGYRNSGNNTQRFNMASGIGGTTPLQRQLSLMKNNLQHHLPLEEDLGVENGAANHSSMMRRVQMEELASM
jgi:hypothetical protein